MLIIPMTLDRCDGVRVACEVEGDHKTWTAALLVDALSTGVQQLWVLGALSDVRPGPGRLHLEDDGRVTFSLTHPEGRIASAPLELPVEVLWQLCLYDTSEMNH